VILPKYIKVQGADIWLSVKAQPRASRTEIVGLLGDELKIKISAPPVEGAANEALTEFLAKKLRVARRSVQLIRGASAAHKVFCITGLGVRDVLARLEIQSS